MRRSHVSPLLLCLAAACGDDPAPGAAAILRFEADPAQVMRGERATVRWEVENARELRLVDRRGRVLVERAPPDAAGEYRTAPLLSDEALTLDVVGPPGTEDLQAALTIDVQVPAPTFLETDAVPSQILSGQAAALSWTTENALAVDVRTSTGASVLEGGPTDGQVVVRPRVSTTYELTARGVERSAAATLEVRVGNRPPSIERFAATPALTAPGRPVTLTWQVVGADGITIRGARTSTVVFAGSASRGSRTVRPPESEDYVLRATGPGGVASATVSVTLRPPEPVRVERFAVAPNPAARGETPEVAWSVRGAERIVIRQDGQIIQSTPQRAGRLPLTLTGGESRLTLTATGAAGRAQAETRAFVHDPPVIRRFELAPPAFAASAPVTVAWAVDNLTQLRLTANGQDVPSFPALTATTGPQRSAQGSLTYSATVTSALTLEAASAAGAVSQTALAVVGAAETEPNDSLADAAPPPASGVTVDRLGRIGPTDTDVYALTVPARASVTAATSSGPGRCEVDTQLRLVRGTVVLATDDDSGVGPCAAIDPRTHPGAGLLRAGTYFLEVRGATAGPYVLTFGLGRQTCGNGRREAPEQCDDGARASGDGCDSACALEPLGPVLGTGTGTVAIGVTTSTGSAVVRVDVARAGQSLTATAAGPAGGCDVVDTRIELLDAAGASLAAAAGGGPSGAAGTCGALDPQADRGARDLRPGRHYLRVRGENAVSGPVVLRYALTDPACGNGLIETRAGEQCDDGNQTSGDGCSAGCAFEGGAAPEREPNGRQATATASGLFGAGRVQLRGEIRPSGDDDVIAFEVPAGRVLRLGARTYSLRGQPTSCDRTITDTRMYLEAPGREAFTPGSGELAFNDDIDTANNVWCSALSGVPVSGGPSGRTYYLRLQGWRDRGTATWFLDLRLDP
jgi:cysteine-rich repeat protein